MIGKFRSVIHQKPKRRMCFLLRQHIYIQTRYPASNHGVYALSCAFKCINPIIVGLR